MVILLISLVFFGGAIIGFLAGFICAMNEVYFRLKQRRK